LPPQIDAQLERVQPHADRLVALVGPNDRLGDSIGDQLWIGLMRIGIDRFGALEVAREPEIERIGQQTEDAAKQRQE